MKDPPYFFIVLLQNQNLSDFCFCLLFNPFSVKVYFVSFFLPEKIMRHHNHILYQLSFQQNNTGRFFKLSQQCQPLIILFSLSVLHFSYFLSKLQVEHQTHHCSTQSQDQFYAHLCSYVFKEPLEADAEFFPISSVIAFQGIVLLLPCALDTKPQRQADFVRRQWMRARQQKRPGCSALVSVHPQAARHRFYQQQLYILPQDR